MLLNFFYITDHFIYILEMHTLATRKSKKNVMEILLRKGADVEAKDKDGLTCLMWGTNLNYY